jgi:hypothetical protein
MEKLRNVFLGIFLVHLLIFKIMLSSDDIGTVIERDTGGVQPTLQRSNGNLRVSGQPPKAANHQLGSEPVANHNFPGVSSPNLSVASLEAQTEEKSALEKNLVVNKEKKPPTVISKKKEPRSWGNAEALYNSKIKIGGRDNRSRDVVEKVDFKDRKLVHVMYSRFMQHEPDLLELGKGRLLLFKSFCLSTIARQRNQNFLWIIRTDPELHQTLKNDLVNAVRNLSNVVIVGSNEVREGSIDGGFRSPAAISDITPESLFHGDLKLVQSYYEAAKDNTLLETNLDTDDGLALTFVETVQRFTLKKFEGVVKENGWMNICIGRHLEWQFYAPWDMFSDKGSLAIGSTHTCVTSGLSWATQVNAVPEFTEAHDLIKKRTPSCRDISKSFFGCWVEVPVFHPNDVMAIRTRTPTSSGMKNIATSDSEWTRADTTIDVASWPLLEQTFAISMSSIRENHRYLKEHLREVVEENLKGQCSKDDSCTENIKNKLKALVFKNDKWKSKHDLVHVIQTSLDSPKSIDIWRSFCFESIEAQTTHEFLWIIRIKNLHDPVIEKKLQKIQLVKVIGRSSLNILVVKSDQSPGFLFRSAQAISDIHENTILHGDIRMLRDFHSASQNRTLLETSLDPNEAITKTFVDDMQSSTLAQLQYSQIDDGNIWYYQCNPEPIEWHYLHPKGEETDTGFATLGSSKDSKCIKNPATTRISLPGAEIPNFNEESQAKECSRMGLLRIRSGCFVPMTVLNETQSAQAVIPKSNEKPVIMQFLESQWELLEEQNLHLRSVLRDYFNIHPYRIEILYKDLQEYQCGNGHICPEKWDSDHGVVHVIQTSLHDLNLFDVWRNWCFSLETSTTKKFLWIVRIVPDTKLIMQVLKPINKTPLNIILVKSKDKPAIDFRQPDSISDISRENILKGDLEMLHYFHEQAQKKPLLETFLETTEAVSKTFIEDLQSSTIEQLKQGLIRDGEDAWYYRCVLDYAQWEYFDPRGSILPNTGFLKFIRPENSTCVERPGTTRVSLPDSLISIDKQALECSSGPGGLTNGCFVPIASEEVLSARALIPKSVDTHSLIGVENDEFQRLLEDHENIKIMLKEKFGIFPVSLKIMRNKVADSSHTDTSLADAWKNKHNIAHVVYTRFMQHQPNLLGLGKARFELFKTFCVATMSQQTNKQFLWIIRIDPELDVELRKKIIQSLEGLSNAVVVGSILGRDGIHGGAFRDPNAMDEFTSGPLFYGNKELVRSFHKAAMYHTLLETNLDSDDGISLTFIDNTQQGTVQAFQYDQDETGWVQLCLGRHMEWEYYSPWEKNSEKGCLMKGKTRNCVKSGMSWAIQPKAKPNFFANTNMMKNNKENCSENRTDADILHHDCWETIPVADPESDVMAIRPMTPASMGIAKGEVSKFDMSIQALGFDKDAWDLLEPYFGLRTENVVALRNFFVNNLKDIVIDNERSKCTYEQTCAGKWRNKHRIVHVIYTSVLDPNYVDLFRRVGLSSLVGQSTNEFLLIIRVADFSDYRLILALLEAIKKSQFADNILLVRSDQANQVEFRSQDSIADISNATVLQGDLTFLSDYYKASQNRPVLETFLESNEAMNRNFVEKLQLYTAEKFKNDGLKDNNKAWYYQCVPGYMERSYFHPTGREVKNGFYRSVYESEGCVQRPGTTRVSMPGALLPVGAKKTTAAKCSPGMDGLKKGCFSPFEYYDTTIPALRVSPDLVSRNLHLAESDISSLDKQQFNLLSQIRSGFSVFPPNLKKMRSIKQETDREFVHIIHTSLQDSSRIATFRHFATDSLQSQTSNDFLWIIRTKNFTDPKDLYYVLYPFTKTHEKAHINTIVVASNYTPTVDFRTTEAVADITEDTILHGEMDMLKDYHRAAGARTVLETFLQPIEAVSSSFIENLQSDISEKLKENEVKLIEHKRKKIEDIKDDWFYLCSPNYIEWTYFTDRGEDSKIGFLKMVDQKGGQCVENPAVTVVSPPGSQFKTSKFGTQECLSSKELKSGCYLPFRNKTVQSVRATIPVSVESPVALQAEEIELHRLEKENKRLLTLLDDQFHILPYSIEVMKITIYERQCGDMHVCTARWDSKFGVVHVIQTSLQDPAMFDVFRNWCFNLEAQTTNKFLWIIRLASNKKLHHEVLKPINKTPLNIIVVNSNYTPNVDFRHPEAISDITNVTSLHGDLAMLQHYHQMAQKNPLLETHLDSKEALAKTFVVELQKTVADEIKKNQIQWYYKCPSEFLELSYITPQEDNSSHDFMKVIAPKDSNCLERPGITKVSLPGSQASKDKSTSTQCSQQDMKDGCYKTLVSKGIDSARIFIPKSLDEAPASLVTEGDLKRLGKKQNELGDILKNDFRIPPILRNQLRIKIREIVEARLKVRDKSGGYKKKR